MERHYTAIDRCLMQIDRALRTACASPPEATRSYPGAEVAETEMTAGERSHAAGLMRVNHAGEVCAQALYSGQALGAQETDSRARLERAAQEETDHLSWCAQRLRELDSRPSYLDPLWYVGSFGLGTLAGLAGDRWSLGFVVETERQVEAHLGDHLNRLPLRDLRSRAVVTTMQADEARHGESARAAGGRELPWPVPGLMRRCAEVMKAVAYRV